MSIPVSTPTENQYFFDWRSEDVITSIRHQQKCNCCWAITAAGAVESLANISYEKRGVNKLQLSPQQLIDCVNENPREEVTDERGCYLLHYCKAFGWIKVNGIAEEKDYPFQAKKGACQRDVKVILKIKDYKKINMNEIDDFLRCQPVAVVVRVTNEFKNLKTSEIYKGPADTKNLLEKARHAVLAVGFGINEESEKFWIIKNSWGTTWGDDGYARISQQLVKVDTMTGEKETNLLESPAIPLGIEFIHKQVKFLNYHL